MKTKLITIFEKKAIETRLHELELLTKRFGAEIGEATNSGGETWHDNASYDAAKERLMHVDKEKYQLQKILRSCNVVEAENTKTVQVGSQVTFTDVDTDITSTYKIGGEVTRLLGEGWLNYQTPVAEILLNNKLGRVATGEVNNRKKKFKIDAIDKIS